MMFDQIKEKIGVFFINYEKIILSEFDKKNEIFFKKFNLNPKEIFKKIEEDLIKIKSENENVNPKNFKKIYTSIFTLNSELR